MFSFLQSIFSSKKPKKIAFIDGDQPLPALLDAYTKYLIGTETHLVRMLREGDKEPKILRKVKDLNKVYLTGYTNGKEVVDKFISAYIQKSVSEGYTEITVVSSDYDFIDIFKMAVQLNPAASDITFRMIVPYAQGRLAEMPEQTLNINVVRM